jgi:type IX secretion system PorP/SprF family membrane protein
MKFILKLFVLFLLITESVLGQDAAPNYLMYRYNMNILNPAYAGVSDKTEVGIGFRKQSTDVQEDPTTQYGSFSKAFSNNLGLGLSIVSDNFFISSQTDIVIDMSYKLQLDRFTNLYFGMKAGGAFYAIDFNSLGVTDPLFSGNESTFSPLVGVGAYLKGERYYMNISTPNLVLSEVQKPKLNSVGDVVSESTKDKFHMYIGGGYRFLVSETIDLTPSFFSRIVTGEEVLLDISATADFSNLVEAGLTYRVDTSVIFSLLLKVINNTHFGYAYEYSTSDFSAMSSGAHEFVVKFQW